MTRYPPFSSCSELRHGDRATSVILGLRRNEIRVKTQQLRMVKLKMENVMLLTTQLRHLTALQSPPLLNEMTNAHTA